MDLSPHWKQQVFDQLTPSQRIELAMDLWDSAIAQSPQPLLTDSQIGELRQRIHDADAGKSTSSPWSDVKRRLLSDPQ